MQPGVLSHLFDTCSEVYLPLVSNANNQAGLPEVRALGSNIPLPQCSHSAFAPRLFLIHPPLHTLHRSPSPSPSAPLPSASSPAMVPYPIPIPHPLLLASQVVVRDVVDWFHKLVASIYVTIGKRGGGGE